MKRRLFNIVVCAFALVGLLAAGPTLAHAAEAPWEQSGEIEWQLDNGTLTIRPANGASEAFWNPNENRPWGDTDVFALKIESKVLLPCRDFGIGMGFRNLKTADLRGAYCVSEEQWCRSYCFKFSSHYNPELKTIITGEGFRGYNPTPEHKTYSSFPDGLWENTETGELYDSQEIPSGVATTWRYFGEDPASNRWVNNGTLKWGCFDGHLTVKPQDGYTTGVAGYGWGSDDSYVSEPMWASLSDQIESATFVGSVVINPESLFRDCKNLKSVDLTGLEIKNMHSVNSMFFGCSSLRAVNLGPFNTTNVTDMSSMFSGCQELEEIDLAPLETSNVTDMRSMFSGCNNLRAVNLETLDTSNVTDMGSMFSGCTKLRAIDLSPLDTSNVTDMSYMFSGCKSLNSALLSDNNTNNVKNTESMFAGCENLGTIDVSQVIGPRTTNIERMFENCKNLESVTLEDDKFEQIENCSHLFYGCSKLQNVHVKNLNALNLQDCNHMFASCTALTSLDLSDFHAPNLKAIDGMFWDCSSLKQINLNGFQTNSVESMTYMFSGCGSLESLDLRSFDTREVVDMEEMFPTWGSKLMKLTVGKNFSFKGYASSSNQAVLEEGSRWESSADGKVYDHDSLPSCVAATYTRVDDPDDPGTPDILFTDVNKNTDHYEDIIWLAENGISAGYPDGSFRPMGTVVRQDMAAFLYRLAGSPAYTPTAQDKKRFSDVTVNTPHAKEIWWLASESISSGYNDGTFRPMAPVYRQDMSAFLHRLCNQFGNGIEAPSKVSFPDVNSKTPHAEDIEWLASVGISMGYPDGTFRPMVPVYRQDMAAFLHRLYNVGM